MGLRGIGDRVPVARALSARLELVFLGVLLLALATVSSRGLPLGIAALGVVGGSVLGLHAVGVVLLYSRTRILSFAQFGLGVAASVLFFVWVQYNQWLVLANGVCRCLAPDGNTMSELQHNPDVFREYLVAGGRTWLLVLNALISAAIGIFLAADTGKRVFLSIAGLFHRAPRIVPTIATLAFAVALAGGAGLLSLRTTEVFGRRPFGWFPYGPRPGTGIDGAEALPEGTFVAPLAADWSLQLSAGVQLRLYDVLAVLLGLGALALIFLRFQRGRRGLDSRATAANLERAATLGVDVIRESRQPWELAGALSGLAGILAVARSSTVPEVGLDMSALTLVMAAVVLARTTSTAWAFASAILLGILDQAMFWNFGSHDQFHGSLVVIIGVALVLQRRRTNRAERDSESVFTTAAEPRPVPPQLRDLPGVHGLLRGASVAVVFAFAAFPFLTTPRQLSLGVVILASMVVGLSLLVLSGWGGQVSLGQLALASTGAYTAAIAGGSWGLPLPFALLLGAAAGGLAAPLLGLPALRLPGPFVAIMTLALGFAVPAVLLNVELLGTHLPPDLARPVLLGIDLSSERSFYGFSLLVLGGAFAVVQGLRRSRLRRALIAARDNSQAASAFGVDITRLQLEAFAVSGALAGLGGGLIAYANGGVQADTFSAAHSVELFLVVVIGGLSAVSGPVIGAALYSFVQLAGVAAVHLLNGLGTIIVLAVRPGGLASLVVGLRDAAIRVILHLQGHDLVRMSDSPDGEGRIAIADRGRRAELVPVRYRLVGDGFGPVEGTRLRPVEGVTVAGNGTADDTNSFWQRDPAEHGGIPLPEEGAAASPAAARLGCHRLDVAYGGAVAVSGVSLDLAPGEILAVIGLNGAGKTSLLRALAGLEPAAHGTVELDGEDVTMRFPHERAAKGVAFVPGGAAVLGTLTVHENLRITGADDEDIARVSGRFPALAERWTTAAGNLSGGEQQVLALAQAVLRRPTVLLVDELSLGLSPEALATVLDLIVDLAEGGTTVVLVEQSITAAMAIAHTALFLESGRVRYQGPAASLRDHPELFASVAFGAGVVAATASGSELARARAAQRVAAEPVLQVRDLTAAYGDVTVVDSVDLEVLAGEVVGVLGPNGAGKTSLFDCLSGTLPASEGTITLLGEDVTALPPHRRAERGLMRSFQSVRLFPSLTVRDCIAVALETRLAVKSSVFAGLWLPPARTEERRVEERTAALVELLNLEPYVDEPLGALSLGTRRMVDLACQLAARPKVLLLDEPASGLAQAETELLGPLVSRISSDLDCAVVIIEHNVQVLASIAHRLVAMQHGAVIADGIPASVLDDPDVRTAYFGAERATALASA